MAELKNKAKIILFSGKAEHGKTTAAGITKTRLESCGYKVLKTAYADYVKHTAKHILGWNGEKDEAGRQLLQWWGTDKVRAMRPDFWADTVVRLADIVGDMFDFILIDDTRYENEITCWTGYKTLAVRVERPLHQNTLTGEQRAHASETALDGFWFDITLSANTLEELHAKIGRELLPAIMSL